MIICKTPFRISFAGGGSDSADFYEKAPGAVISTTINKYMYLMVHPNFNTDKILLKYSKTEEVSHPSKLKHLILSSILKDLKLAGLEISTIADIPAKTGLGSSSSLTVGLHHVLGAYTGKQLSKEELAQNACNTEIIKLKKPIGKQDQYAAAYGGLNLYSFLSSGKVKIERVCMDIDTQKQLDKNLLMFYTGITRSADKILKEQRKKISKSQDVFKATADMVEIAYKMRDALEKKDLESFGKLMHDAWIKKRSLTKDISNKFIDHYYDLATKKGGALGGKLLGAGGGGFLLFYCEEKNHKKLRATLKELQEMQFSFTDGGSEIIFNDQK